MSAIGKVYRVRTEPQAEPLEHHYCRKGSLVVIDSESIGGRYWGYGIAPNGGPIYQHFRTCDLKKLEFDEEVKRMTAPRTLREMSLATLALLTFCAILAGLLLSVANRDDRLPELTAEQRQEIVGRWPPHFVEVDAGLSQPKWVSRKEIKK